MVNTKFAMADKKHISSTVIWITGYSASGKSTVARQLEIVLREQGCSTVCLDGDDLRTIFGNQWGHTREERVELGKVYFRMCNYLASQGLTVVIAAVGMLEEVRKWFSENIEKSLLVYLDVPKDERVKRDQITQKGVYTPKQQKINAVYQEPTNADVVVKNYGSVTPEDAVKRIIMSLTERVVERPKHEKAIASG